MSELNKFLPKRFFLAKGENAENEVSIDEYRAAETEAGFYPKRGDLLATSGFSSIKTGSKISGRVEY